MLLAALPRGWRGLHYLKVRTLAYRFCPHPSARALSKACDAERGMVDPIPERSVFDFRFSMGLDPKRKIQPDTT